MSHFSAVCGACTQGGAAYRASVQAFVATWLESTRTTRSLAGAGTTAELLLNPSAAPRAPAAAAEAPAGVYYTPKGLAKAKPGGTLQHTANAAFLVMAAADVGALPAARFMRHACWVRNQIGYMLVSRRRVRAAAACPALTAAQCLHAARADGKCTLLTHAGMHARLARSLAAVCLGSVAARRVMQGARLSRDTALCSPARHPTRCVRTRTCGARGVLAARPLDVDVACVHHSTAHVRARTHARVGTRIARRRSSTLMGC
jgi:hypothetical protein